MISDVLGSVHPRNSAENSILKYSGRCWCCWLLLFAFICLFLQQFKYTRLDRVSHLFLSIYLLELCVLDSIISHLICSFLNFFFCWLNAIQEYLYTDLQLNFKYKTKNNWWRWWWRKNQKEGRKIGLLFIREMKYRQTQHKRTRKHKHINACTRTHTHLERVKNIMKNNYMYCVRMNHGERFNSAASHVRLVFSYFVKQSNRI